MSSLAQQRWPEVGPTGSTVIVPVGSVEQHGPHLPLGTDTIVAAAVAARLPGLCAPPVQFGASGEHESFPGTVSIGTEVLAAVLVELGRSACRWAARVCFVNGHGGNGAALVEAVRLLRYEGRDAGWLPCAVPGADAHAGRTETSLLLHLAPGEVRLELAEPGNTTPVAELLPALREGGVAAVAPNGVLGDPRGASAAEGARLFAEVEARATAAYRRWSPDDNGRLR